MLPRQISDEILVATLGLHTWRAPVIAVLTLFRLTASGTYQPRLAPPLPHWQAAAARYEVGKAIFQGRMSPAASSPVIGAERLKRIRLRMPAPALEQAQLAAGGYTDEQLQALEYFLEIRFKVKP